MNHWTTLLIQSKEVFHSLFTYVNSKIIASLLFSVGSYLIGVENFEWLACLCVLIVIDLLTGVIAAVKMGYAIESRKALKSTTKLVVYLLLFTAVHLTSHSVPSSAFLVSTVSTFLILTELLSIVENVAKAGYAVPKRLLNQIGGLTKEKSHRKGNK